MTGCFFSAFSVERRAADASAHRCLSDRQKFADATNNPPGQLRTALIDRIPLGTIGPSNDISAALERRDYFVINKRDASLSKERDPK